MLKKSINLFTRHISLSSMRVLFISEYFPPLEVGGGEISAFLLAKKLAKSGIKVEVLTSCFRGLKRFEIIDKVQIHRTLRTGKGSDLRRYLMFEKSLLKELKKIAHNYDIIHCFNTNSIVAAKIKNYLKKPFVMHVNGPLVFCPKGTLMYNDKKYCQKNCTRLTFLKCFLNSRMLGPLNISPLLKYSVVVPIFLRRRHEKFLKLMKCFDHYIAISSFMKQRLIMQGISENKISVIYNITQYDDFLKLSNPHNDLPKLLYLGGYSSSKGADILVKALTALYALGLEFEANFYGDGVLKPMLKKYVEKHHLRITLHNKVNYNEMPKIIEKHDIVVFPSNIAEAFGRAALEACAAGKTVVASNIGGVSDIIEEGKTGYLFNPGNVKSLLKQLQKAIKNPLNPSLIRKHIKNKFSNEKSINEVIDIYNQLKNG